MNGASVASGRQQFPQTQEQRVSFAARGANLPLRSFFCFSPTTDDAKIYYPLIR